MKTQERFTLRGAVYLILQQENKILLLKRFNTGWSDGKYTLCAGHLDGNESAIEAMRRETKEEIGIDIRAEDVSVVHIMHQKSTHEYVDFYILAKKWTGEPVNCEPNKCSEIIWADIHSLPAEILPNVKKALHEYLKSSTFSELGFTE